MARSKKEQEPTRSYGTIGNMEAVAGIDADHASRGQFWRECMQQARTRFGVEQPTGAQVFKVARERCHAMIAARVQAGVLCLV